MDTKQRHQVDKRSLTRLKIVVVVRAHNRNSGTETSFTIRIRNWMGKHEGPNWREKMTKTRDANISVDFTHRPVFLSSTRWFVRCGFIFRRRLSNENWQMKNAKVNISDTESWASKCNNNENETHNGQSHRHWTRSKTCSCNCFLWSICSPYPHPPYCPTGERKEIALVHPWIGSCLWHRDDFFQFLLAAEISGGVKNKQMNSLPWTIKQAFI